MSKIYDPISGKNLTASQIQNRINSPNLGAAYKKAGVTSVDEVKNYNPSAASSSSPSVNIINKTVTESQYEAMLNDPNYRYTAGDDKAFTKITIVNDNTGQVFRERLITPKLREDGTKYEAWGRSTSFGFGDNSSYGRTAEEAASIWAKQNSGNPELAAEGYQQKAENLINIYTSRGQSVEIATNAANRLIYDSVKAVSDITGLDFKKAAALQAGGVIADRRNLDAIISASKVDGKLSSSSFLENMRKGNNQVLRKGLQLDPISTEKDEYGKPVDPNGILDANGNVVDGRFAQNRPNLVKISDNIYLNTETGYSVAAASNGALLTQITGNTLNQMWSYGIGRDQFQKVRDYANNSNIKLVGLEQGTIDKVDWDSVQTTAGDTSFLVDYQASIESDQTLRSPEAAKPEDIVPGTTTAATPEPTYDETPTAIPVDTTTTEEPQQPTTPSTPTPTTPSTPTSTTPYTPTPTTVTGQPVEVGVTPTGVYPQAPVTGAMGTPVQTSGMSSVPQTVQVRPDYTGTTMSNLTSQSQGGFGGIKKYKNSFGQEISVTVDASGNPLTFVPLGYTAAAEGGLMGFDKGGLETDPIKSSEDIYLKIAQKVMNFQGDSSELKKQMAANPALAAKLGSLTDALTNMTTTRMGAAPGTDVGNLSSQIGPDQFKKMQQDVVTETMVPPQQAAVQQITPEAADFIPTTAGMAPAQADMAQAATVGTVQQAQMPMTTAASTMTPTTVTPQVQAETDALQAQTGTLSDEAQVDAQQQLTSSVTGMEAATGESVDVTGAPTRTMQVGERVEGTGVDQAQVAQAFGTGEVQAASVQDELAGLMQQFEGGDTPAWAAGSMRAATQMLAARGLGASSLAGQAVIQAAMEAALPIAQIDAGNKQQMALFKAEQRAKFLGIEFDQAFQAKVMNAAKVSEIANMQFSADQQIALENSRAANTMELNNLSNRQAMVMAEAAALSQLDMANLNNRQQSAVQNAQNFLQMDMANLNNEQQTAMFKAQQNIQALFTDQAAENAAAQFNATSENQTNQFFASLSAQTSQFNAAQQNAMDQFNINNVNALRQFNAEVQNQRTMFNAQNGLVVAQANAQWRQNIATMNTAALNESNMNFAQTMNELTATNLDEIWQRERDLLSMAFQVSENNANRANEVVLQKIAAQAQKDAAKLQADLEAEANTGDFIKEVIVSIAGWN